MVTDRQKTPKIKRASSQLKHFPYLHVHKFISESMCFSKTALSAWWHSSTKYCLGSLWFSLHTWQMSALKTPLEMLFSGHFVLSRSACFLTLVSFSFLSGFWRPQGQVSKFTSLIHCYVCSFGIFFFSRIIKMTKLNAQQPRIIPGLSGGFSWRDSQSRVWDWLMCIQNCRCPQNIYSFVWFWLAFVVKMLLLLFPLLPVFFAK